MSHERRQTLRFITQAACACLKQANSPASSPASSTTTTAFPRRKRNNTASNTPYTTSPTIFNCSAISPFNTNPSVNFSRVCHNSNNKDYSNKDYKSAGLKKDYTACDLKLLRNPSSTVADSVRISRISPTAQPFVPGQSYRCPS